MKPALPQDAAWQSLLRKYRWQLGGIVVTGILLLGILLSVAPSRKSGIVWLSPAQLAATTRPGPLAKLKSQISRIMGPLVQRLRKRDVQINFNSKVLAVSTAMLEDQGLTPAAGTNSDATRVWVLSSSELKELLQRVRTSGTLPLSEASVTTLDRRRFIIFSGGSPPIGTNAAVPTSNLDIFPKIVRDKISLTLGVTATVFVRSPGATVLDVRTNVSAGLRLSVPNAGAVLLLSGATNSDGRVYGIIVNPVAIDPAGNPLKL